MLKEDYGDFWKLKLNDDGVLICTMSDPEKRNSIHHPRANLFADICDDVAYDGRVRAVVVTGQGKAFCAGGNLDSFLQGDGVVGAALSPAIHRVWTRIIDLPPPLIMAINGDAIGVGSTLALMGDIILAAEHARIGDPHVPLGILASSNNSLFPAAMSIYRAKEWLLTGDLMNAQEARENGLFNRIYPADILMDEALKLATRLAKQPKDATQLNKRVLNRIVADNMNWLRDTGLGYEAYTAGTQEHKDAVRAKIEMIQAKKAARASKS